MALARFTNISLDVADPATVGRFWAAALHLEWQPDGHGEGGVVDGERTVLWLNRVPEAKTVKHRVHLDIYAASLDDLTALGASVLLPEGDDRRWTVMADPEGGEFCAFVRAEPPSPRLHGLAVDCADHPALARFWAGVLGGDVADRPSGYTEVSNVPGMTFTFDFASVPEAKSGKNRVHWDLVAPDVAALVDAGAHVLRKPDGESDWHVLADPQGNEFCVVTRPDEVA